MFDRDFAEGCQGGASRIGVTAQHTVRLKAEMAFETSASEDPVSLTLSS